MADVTRLDDLLLLPAGLGISRPYGTLVRDASGDIYIQTASPSGSTYALVISAGGAAAPANVLTVAESGGQYTAIEDALADAVAGDTVLVYPGTYIAPAPGYVVPAGVTLQGVSRDTVILDGVTNAPNVIVELGAGSVLAEVQMTIQDAVSARGVLVLGASARIYGIRVGAQGPISAMLGIDVSAANCEIRDVTFFAGIATGLIVQAAGSARVFDLATQGQIFGLAGSSFIYCHGSLWLFSAAIRTSAGDGITADASSGAGLVEAHDANVVVGGTNAFLVTDAGEMHLRGCRSLQQFSASAHANVVRAVGSDLPTLALTQTTAGSVLPSRFGTAVILSGNASIAVPVATIGGAAYDGRPAFAALKEADGVITVANCTWDGSGNLTISTTAVTTGDRDVSWFIPG